MPVAAILAKAGGKPCFPDNVVNIEYVGKDAMSNAEIAVTRAS